MTKREGVARLAGLVVTLLPLVPGQVTAHHGVIPTDSVSTVLVTDTVPGFGAVGGAVTDALAQARLLTKAGLELVVPGP